MKIKSVGLKGFRGYADYIKIEFSDLLVLVGKNDIGKSTVLEALDIFFNEGKGSVKLDRDDINKRNLANGHEDIEISVEFEGFQEPIVIDSTNKTTLREEYLLTKEGTLRILKRYPGQGKEKVFIQALHPTAAGSADLLLKSNSELKKILENNNFSCSDKTKNSELRKSIWEAQSDLKLQEIDIEVAKIDSKNIWDHLKTYMPLYSLFQSDRKNTDGDDEVQDPMRIAVKEILGDASIRADLAKVAANVKQRLDVVANQTLIKLAEFNSKIAGSLNPKLPDFDSLKWSDVFKSVSISGDNDIPINKRGSGVKRLVLISFFRAEAERRQKELSLPSVVYAIEEPETSQHPEHQRLLISALIELSRAPKTQIVLTTHSPEIVKQLEFDNIILITGQDANGIRKIEKNELPYPSLNEVNFAAFTEATVEYHNELYGYIQESGKMNAYKAGKQTMAYDKINQDGTITTMQVVLTDYIRHQIHHPENLNNIKYDETQLHASINEMRTFIQSNR